jgi:hypothetical protein
MTIKRRAAKAPPAGVLWSTTIYEPPIDWSDDDTPAEPRVPVVLPLRYTLDGARIAYTLADGTDVLVAPPDGSTGFVRWLDPP